jgi:FkbM family methyltransferase
MLYNKYDVYVGGSLQRYGEFSLFEQKIFETFIRTGNLVVEVGANIGAHTIFLSRLVGESGQIHAFEPQRLVFQALCANLAINQCTNVYAQQLAVGDHNGIVHVPAVDPSIRNNFGGISLVNVSAGEPVVIMPLDDLDLPACHALKVDVEGMEVQVLKGATRTIDRYRPIMYVENDRQENSGALLQLILDSGYEIYWHLPILFNPNNFAGEAEDIFPNIVSVNILCVPSEARIAVHGLKRIVNANESWR